MSMGPNEGWRPPPGDEPDLASAMVPTVVKAAGGLVAGAGLTGALIAVQTLSGFSLSTPITVGLALLGIIGVADIVVGFALVKARPWAPAASLGGSLIIGIATLAWLGISLSLGLLSLFALLAPGVAVGAGVMTLLAMDSAKKVAQARARLRASGMDLGL